MLLIKIMIREVTVQIKGAGYKVRNFRGVNSYNGKSGELFQINAKQSFQKYFLFISVFMINDEKRMPLKDIEN